VNAALQKEAEGTLPMHISDSLPAIVKSGAPELAPLRFFFETSVVRHHLDGSEHWFCASDLVKFLDYPSVEYAVKKHCIEKPRKFQPDSSSKPLLYVSEADCYNWALRSSSPDAMPFRRLVTQKLLPAIRKFEKFTIRKEEVQKILESEGIAIEGKQLELFPDVVKIDFKKFGEMRDGLKNCRAWLASQGKEFPAHDDYLRYLLQEGMRNVGFGG